MEGTPPNPTPTREKLTDAGLNERSSGSEDWVARPELPYSREYVGFQVSVAREVANRLGVPLSEIADDYTTIFHAYIWPGTDSYLPIDTMTDEEIVSAIYDKEVERSASRPLNEYKGIGRFGCFSYFAHTGGTGKGRKGSVDIHFSNVELDEIGPLDKERVERRLRELKDLFTEIRNEYPEATLVRGDSWLYNIEAYKRLFPESFTADPKMDTSKGALLTGRTWGQFCDSKLGLKEDLAKRFLNAIRTLEEVTPETVREALPYQALIVTGSIEDFYNKVRGSVVDPISSAKPPVCAVSVSV